MKAIIDKSTKTVTFVDADVEFVLEVLNNGKWLDSYEFFSVYGQSSNTYDPKDNDDLVMPPLENDTMTVDVMMDTDQGTFVGYYDYELEEWIDNDQETDEVRTNFTVYNWKYLEA